MICIKIICLICGIIQIIAKIINSIYRYNEIKNILELNQEEVTNLYSQIKVKKTNKTAVRIINFIMQIM